MKSFEWNQRQLEERLKMNSSDTEIENIDYQILTTAVEMFVFMNFCPNDYLTSYKNKDFMDFIKKYSLQDIMLFLNRMKISSTDGFKDVATKALNKLKNILSLKYNHISQLLISGIEKVDLIEKDTLTTNKLGNSS